MNLSITTPAFCLSAKDDRDFLIMMVLLGVVAVAGLIALVVCLFLKRRRAAASSLPEIVVPPLYDIPTLREYFGLTAREADVLERMLDGEEDVVIAQRLGISLTTVQGHIRRIYEKTDARSLHELTGLCRICRKN